MGIKATRGLYVGNLLVIVLLIANILFTASMEIVIISAVGIGILVVGTLYTYKSITRPLKETLKIARQITARELEIDKAPKVKNEFGELSQFLHEMGENLKSIFVQLNSVSDQLVTSSSSLKSSTEQTNVSTNQMAASIQEVASSVDIQGKNIQESATAMSEITIGIGRVAQTTNNVAESASETTTQANLGNNYIQKIDEQMNSIYKVNHETNSVMKELEDKSTKIGSIIGVITGIADQTNLLALNAAIESARAGEHGKGFAVVANEVRLLAEQSKEASKQIEEIIKLIQEDTNQAYEMTNKATIETKNGLELVQITGKTFTQILTSIENVSAQTQELSAVVEEMSASTEQVNASFEDVSQLAQNSTSKMAEIAAASEQNSYALNEVFSSTGALAEVAEQLQGMVKK
ncbi:methyl-accepting chemotaxis protein [Ureibacillus chungkukjangi]|uniref:Methyl-accepting chemotaxis protein n=1 Tax=Ureibacillus chungkukjangi TaxID=1202712 RepID=A0A318TPG6_9BACL|nr:HAMP domain-containing methyl-accepting chemotaxis protein [Ureibacillus chungkukjangi]MCM3388777.1 HAMP domain-containing methyl-accepting chemotaxis protein [Ureibacillus chungkukjangi]PYF06686.1 methyl-accepting chemotaxis protein [Ureibacillus chungkukjangi]